MKYLKTILSFLMLPMTIPLTWMFGGHKQLKKKLESFIDNNRKE